MTHVQSISAVAIALLSIGVVGCTGGSLGADSRTVRALDADQQALTELQNNVISSRGNRCAASQDAMRRFQSIVSRNGRGLNSEIVEIVRTSIESLVTTYCQGGGDAGVGDAGTTVPPTSTGSGSNNTGSTGSAGSTGGGATGSTGSTAATGQIIMCGSASCGYCRQARALLDSLGATYTYLDLSSQAGIDQCFSAVQAKGSSRVSMPTVLNTQVGNVINGYNEQMIRDLVNQSRGGSSTPAGSTGSTGGSTGSGTGSAGSSSGASSGSSGASGATSGQVIVYGREATCGRCRAAAQQLTQANVTFTRCDFSDNSCLNTASQLISSNSIGMPVISYKGHLIYPYSSSALAAAIQQYGR